MSDIYKEGSKRAILLIYCPDQKGLVSQVSDFLQRNNGNILYLDQHVDAENKIFFMRVEWDLEDFIIPEEKCGEYFKTLIADRFQMEFRLYFSDQIMRMALFVSKMPHCLEDILVRVYSGEWKVEVPLIISNHTDLEYIAKRYNIDFYHFAITPENKQEQEQKQLEILQKYNIDFIVLARYMQIVSPKLITGYQDKIINIHHSFLPAFPGAKPYHSAYKRGVKIIGATSHYVTEELDAGPIIEQDVTRVSHKETVNDLVRKGKDLEKMVLSRAIWNHIQHRILAYGNRTVVFD